jgi:hypothetical protein
MTIQISALGRRLAELHGNVRQLETDIKRFGDNPHFASRLSALLRAVAQVESQIAATVPLGEDEYAVRMVIDAKLAGRSVDTEALPGGFDLGLWCGGAYTERVSQDQLLLPI